MTKNITFDEARDLLGGNSVVRIDGIFYALAAMEDRDIISLRLTTDATLRVVEFHRDAHAAMIHVSGNKLSMFEHHGGDATVEIFGPVLLDIPTSYCTAETAAALMDAIHSEVTPQFESSESAYSELYESTTRMEGGFPLVWSWVATMAEAARERMEALWKSGEVEFIECVPAAAQEFHNYITDPRTTASELTLEKAEELWESALTFVVENNATQTKWQEEAQIRAMLRELKEATRSDAGYAVGCVSLIGDCTIEYTNYGGPTVSIHRLSNGLWRAGDDAATDSPRPVGAFKIASIPIVRG